MDTTKAFPASINQRYGRRCRYIGFAIKSNTTEIVKHTTVRNRENIASNNNDNKTKKKRSIPGPKADRMTYAPDVEFRSFHWEIYAIE